MTTPHTEPDTAAETSDAEAHQRVYPYVVHKVDPCTLRVDRNSRVVGDIRASRPDLVNSIAVNGMNPIASVVNVAPDPDGVLAVLVGFHRTAAAVAVKKRENPELLIDVLVHAPGTTRRELLVAQGIENFHREGYTQAEEAGLYDQLALEGLDDEQISEQLSRPVERVRAGRRVAANPTTQAASEALPQVDLLTLAHLAEFGDDESAHQELVDTLNRNPANLGWKLDQVRNARQRRALRTDHEAQLIEQGYAIIDEDELPDGVAELETLCDGQDTTPLDPGAHGECPGRAAEVSVDYQLNVHIAEYCVDFASHGHHTIASVAIAAEQDRLTSTGVKVVDADDETAVDVRFLRADDETDRVLTAETHADCPGHAAYVRQGYTVSSVSVHYVCTDPDTHGHRSSITSTAQSRPDSAYRAAEVKRAAKNNKLWHAAKASRRAWLATFFAGWRRRKAEDLPARVHRWLALAPILAANFLAEAAPAHSYACALLKLAGPKGTGRGGNPLAAHLQKKSTTETQAILIRLAQIIGACEAHWDLSHTEKNADATWRKPPQDARFYFTLLEHLGYPLDHVETLLNNPDADNEHWPHLAAAAKPADSAVPEKADPPADAADDATEDAAATHVDHDGDKPIAA